VLPTLGEGTVLEIGCGNGKTLASLPAGRTVAVDFSSTAVHYCHGLFPDVHLAISDATTLPFRDGCFETVVASHVIGHAIAVERRKMASEVHRVLARGGTTHMVVFSKDDMRYGKGKEVEPNSFVRGNGIMYHYFDEDELESLFPSMDVQRIGRKVEVKRFGKESFERSTIEAVLVKQ
jgi:ubiquinone/menaquinone biosynthesis C-methylase UbiE